MDKPAHIIVFGNEKGGTGKSTLAAHVAVSLLGQGKQVAILDIDGRQKSLARFMENRAAFIAATGQDLKTPISAVINSEKNQNLKDEQQSQEKQLEKYLEQFKSSADFILIDCPGNDTVLSRLAHALADTLITPLNDSFVDLDLLAHVDPMTYKINAFSHYTQMVWDSRKFRSAAGQKPLNWIVTRNRLATLDSHNNRRVDHVLKKLQSRIKFRYVSGVNERVIFRELFPQGLTMFDLQKINQKEKIKTSHVAARFEIKNLIDALELPLNDPLTPALET